MTNPFDTLTSLWTSANCAADSLNHIHFSETEYQLPAIHHVGAIASATIGAQALAAADIWKMRTGRSQHIDINMKHVMATFRSERYLTVDGQPPADLWSPIAGYYQAKDQRWIQLHTNFPHHSDGVLRVLQCENTRASVTEAIAHWHAAELESRLAAEGMCAAMIRTPSEWNLHPQAAAIRSLPLIEIERIGDAPAEPIGHKDGKRPLSDVRMLDLSRVLAGPVAARAFAQHGADVLAVSAAHLPNIIPLIMDTGRGKRATQLDLRDKSDAGAMHELVRGTDVFMQAYRPNALASLGFDPQPLIKLRPGLIYVTLSAYGHIGSWSERRGFDSLVQSATGIAWQEGQALNLEAPGKLPCQALDHATGYLVAFGAMVALQRRAIEGGSWQVRVSLAQTGHWLQSLGQFDGGIFQPDLSADDIAGYIQKIPSSYGNIKAISPAEKMSETTPHFELPPAQLDADAPVWN